jgi:hypothetical protein
MKSWVDVEGSGVDVTLITGGVCESWGANPTTGLVVGAGNAQLRLLRVENTCAGAGLQSIALFNDENASRFDRLTLRISGAADHNVGVFNSGDDVELTHLAVVAMGASSSQTGLACFGDRLTVRQSSFLASGSMFSDGAVISGNQTKLTDVVATARDATVDNIGLSLFGDGITLTNVTAVASGAGGSAPVGISASDASFRMEGGVAQGHYGISIGTSFPFPQVVALHNVSVNGSEYGLKLDVGHTGGNLDVMVNNCSIRGVTNSIKNSSANGFVGGTQLAGGAVTGAGVTCAGVWDESYTFSASTCP